MGSLLDDGIYTLGKMFAFDVMCYVTDLTGRLGQVDTFDADQIVHFSNLEFVANSRGELVLQGLMSCQD